MARQHQLVAMIVLMSMVSFGCGSSNFNAAHYESSLNDGLAQGPEAYSDEVVNSNPKCELIAPVKINLGEKANFDLKTNFEIPKEVSYVWSGQSLGVKFSDNRNAYYMLTHGLKFDFLYQAGIHERQLEIYDAKMNLICQTNVVSIEFVDTSVDQACTSIGGQISTQDSKKCEIESWTLYNYMKDRGIAKVLSSTSGAIGLANPASVFCGTIGSEKSVQTEAGTHGVCVVDKYKLAALVK